jgi:hypothetical protein
MSSENEVFVYRAVHTFSNGTEVYTVHSPKQLEEIDEIGFLMLAEVLNLDRFDPETESLTLVPDFNQIFIVLTDEQAHAMTM